MKALIWDVDGTLVETERDGHRVAFNLAFESFGLPWRWGEARYGELLRVTGGRERLLCDMATRGDAPALAAERAALAQALHDTKNRLYAERVAAGCVALRDGVAALMQQCDEAGITMAIATTTSRCNVDALLQATLGAGWRGRFAAQVCGEDVRHKKPDPEVYLQVLQALRLSPLDAVAIEDSPGGVAAAQAAEVPVLVTRSAYFADAPLAGAIAIGPGLHTRRGWRPAPGGDGPVTLADIARWHREMDSVSEGA